MNESVPNRGVLLTFSAYLLWGFFPAFFTLLIPASPTEVIGVRVISSLFFSLVVVTIFRSWNQLKAIFTNKRSFLTFLVGGILVFLNWYIYLIAVLTGHVIESALGYFINPITTVLLGVVFFKENLRPLQWIAIGIGTVAVLVLSISYGQFPWLALSLALTFSGYALVKNRFAKNVRADVGVAAETIVILPFAFIALFYVASTAEGLVFGTAGPAHTFFMIIAGLVTIIPLLIFAAGAKSITLVAIGLIQFVAPIMQFLFGYLIMKEPMPAERWVGFTLIWVALIFVVADMIVSNRKGRRAKTTAL
ncbi:MAG: EamA family transporter RarD [Microbacteriaceae bacterium]|nr:EamA family transporter RarD [Microbacteriaceae bacterium]